jgi:hypothetical protein
MRAKFGRFFRHRNQKSKLGNIRVSYDGHSFASKLEAAVYFQLKILLMAGEIEILSFQPRVHLTDARILYIPDFKCRNLKTNEIYFVEAKGFETTDWKIKKRLWEKYGPGPLHIWHGTYLRPLFNKIIQINN